MDIQKAQHIVQSFIIPPDSIPSFTGIANQDNNTTQNYGIKMMYATEAVNNQTWNQIHPPHNVIQRNVSLHLHELLLVLESPLHDKTLPWNSNIHRYWWSTESKTTQQQQQSFHSTQIPPAMLLLTTMSWNPPNQTYATQVYRGIRVREFMDGINNHPWSHPTAWEDIHMGRRNISNTTRYYIFLDYDPCRKMIYPNYGRGTLANADLFGREYHPPFKSSSSKSKPPVAWGEDTPLLPTWLQQHALQSDLWKHSAPSSSSITPQQSTVHLVLWDCVGLGPLPLFRQLPESHVDKTTMFLQNYTESDICTMHRNVQHIYHTYFSNGRQILDGLIRHHHPQHCFQSNHALYHLEFLMTLAMTRTNTSNLMGKTITLVLYLTSGLTLSIQKVRIQLWPMQQLAYQEMFVQVH